MALRVEFGPAIDACIATEEVQRALRQPAGTIDELVVRERLAERLPEVESLLGPVLEEQRRLQNQLEQPFEAVQQLQGVFRLERMLMLTIAVVAAVGLFGLMLYFFYVRDDDRINTPAFSTQMFGALLGTAGIVAVSTFRLREFNRRFAELHRHLEDRLAPVRPQLAITLEKRDQQIGATIRDYIFEIIGELTQPFYQSAIYLAGQGLPPAPGKRASSARGLAEILDKVHEVPTLARRRMMQLLETLPGANIGLSGPRGVGKSTLLRSVAGANLKLGEKEAVAIYTAAPVHYEGRDFVLHLFSSLCRQVLRTNNVPDLTYILSFRDGEKAPEAASEPLRLARRILLLAGVVAGGMVLALHQMLPPGLPGKATPLLTQRDLSPLLLFGIAATGLGLALYLAAYLDAGSWFNRRLSRYWRKADRTTDAAGSQASLLVETSQRHLREIAFQRSFTAGQSGGLKLPAGIDASTTFTASLARRAETFPELVEKFTGYVRLVAETYGAVIIAIDELDKLRSREEAENFINEMKTVFNVPKCFYLVSVSEDALTSFARRGLALRDAFDSAFDDIRYVGPMDLTASRQMLARRVLHLPDPFVRLCYALSGGLPRDLIRAARSVFDACETVGSPAEIEAVASILLQEETSAKIRASIAATRNLALEPETTAFVLAMNELKDLPLEREEVEAGAARLLEVPERIDPARDLSPLLALQVELGAYLRFLREILLMCRRMSTARGWEEVVADGTVERLAEIRRSLEYSVGAAAARLNVRPPAAAAQ